MSKTKTVRRVVKATSEQQEPDRFYVLFAVVRGVPVMKQCDDLQALVQETRRLLPDVHLGSLYITAVRGYQVDVAYNGNPSRPQFQFRDPVTSEVVTTEVIADTSYTELVDGFVASPEPEESEQNPSGDLPEIPGFADDLFGLG